VQVGPYRTLDELGRGGMGVVYRAQDAAGQVVALKVLLPHRAAQPHVRQRFLHELRSLSKLRHPHLVRLLAAGEHDDVPWLALEFVEGQSLEQRLHAGPLPVEQAVRLTAQLASAVAYLHDCGVVHRDLKPANVLLRGGEALLTDFGLVLDADDFERTRLTATGAFLGTPGYWSPEQAHGAKHEQGPHTDLYGLGAVLYACLVGRPPLVGDSLADFLRTQTFQRVEAPHVARPDVPRWLSALCLECLDPDPAGRPASAHALARRLHGGAAAPPPAQAPPWRALALVLPLTLLAVGGAVWVTTRDGAATPSTLELPAGESSDAPSDPAIDGSSTGQPPAQPAEAELPDVAAALGEVKRALSRGRFEQAEALAREACQAFPGSARAHHLLARACWRQGHTADAERAVERALALQPDYARALLLRARLRGGREQLEQGLADLDRAIELEPTLDDAYVVRGHFLSMLGRYADALPDLRRGTEHPGVLRPAITWTTYGVALREVGRLDEAEVAFGRALELDPGSNQAQGNRAALRLRVGDYAAALEDIEAVLARSPSDAGSHAVRAQVLRELGRHTEALAAFERATELDPSLGQASAERAALLLEVGEYARAEIELVRLVAENPEVPSLWLNLGMCQLGLERYAQAVETLDRYLALEPDLPRGWTLRGTAWLAQSRWPQALADFDRALELDPGDAEVLTLRSRAWRQAGRQAEALKDLGRAEAAGAPRDLPARAILLEELGRYPEAEAVVERVLQARPDDVGALAARLRLDRAQGKRQERRNPTRFRLHQLAPLSHLTFRERLDRTRTIASLERAYREFAGAAAELDPAPGWVSDYAGRAALFLGELGSARQHFAAALAATSQPPAAAELHLWRVLTDALIDDLPAAQAAAERALSAAPPATPFVWEAALWLAGLGRPAPLRELVRAETPAPAGIRELAQAVLGEGPVDPAPLYAACDTPLQRAYAACFLALRAEREGDLELARERYREARAYPHRSQRPRAWAELRLAEWGE